MFCISSLSRPEPYPARISSVSIRMDQIRTRYGPDTDQTRTGYGRVLNIGLIIRYVEKTYLEFLTAKLQITCKNSRFFETFREIFRFIVYQFENLSK